MFREPQVNFYVRDVERSVRFYTELFGFEESFRTPQSGPPEHVEVRLGGFILGLAANAAALNTHGVVTGGGNPRAGLVLWTDDVDQVYARLTGQGVEVISNPHDFLDGRLRVAWFADPDGNPIEVVMQRAPAAIA
ncbi:MAG TPA: VOC family protein [Thermomicrobiales bacterium]|nr:VOC family protein [Thermomicrobiales bacterium]